MSDCYENILGCSVHVFLTFQEVDLVSKLLEVGLEEAAAVAVLDRSPTLQLSCWVGAGPQCAAEMQVLCCLDDGRTPFPATTLEYGASFPYDKDALASQTASGRLEAGEWRRVRLLLAGYVPGVRRCTVVLRGRDGHYWRGHYGARFSGCRLQLVPRDNGTP